MRKKKNKKTVADTGYKKVDRKEKKKKEETTEDYTLTVLPRQYDDKTVNKKMKEAFEYLELHMKGENKSLQKVEKDLIFSLDPEEFPFDMEVQPSQYSLIDETGKVKNTPEELTDAGYEKKEIQKGTVFDMHPES